MFTVHRKTTATPERVWAVLAEGWLFPAWVVGTSRVRAVDPGWPGPGARLHHSVGVWPLLLDDTTTVSTSTLGRQLVLRARGWPAGEARIELRLDAAGSGCRITMSEDATRGLGRFVPAPLRRLGIVPRNTECLRRLTLLAEGRPQITSVFDVG